MNGFDPLIILRLNLMQKAGVGAAVVVLVLATYWYMWMNDRQTEISSLEQTITQQEADIEVKKTRLSALPRFKKEYDELVVQEERVKRELPSQTEVAKLLEDISLAGHSEGLQFQLFAPRVERKKEFYADVPVELKFVGSYHEMAKFLQNVGRMPRIVNVSDLNIVPGAISGELTASAEAVTYRFLDAAEIAAISAEKAKLAAKNKKK